MTKSLKQEVRPQLVTVLVANVVTFSVLMATHVLALPAIQRDLGRTGESVGLSALTAVVCIILTEQFGPMTKARIVFWRWNDPLPGARAFTEIGPNDPRVDMERVRQALKDIPTDPKVQNASWYQLYTKVEREARVWDVQKGFLFARDYACLALLLALSLGPYAVWRLAGSGPSLLYSALLVGQYLLARNAATNLGSRFVATVLAVQPERKTPRDRRSKAQPSESTP